MRRIRTRHALLLILPLLIWSISGWTAPLKLVNTQYTSLSSQADPVSDILKAISKDDFMDLVGGLSGEHPVSIGGQPVTLTTRYTPSEGGTLSEQYIYEYFKSLGLATQYHAWTGTTRCLGISGRNVVAEIAGKADPKRIYLITSHLDSISPSPLADAPGADDDGSGTAGVMLAAKILRAYSFDYTLRFVTFTGEERGLCGSNAYASEARTRNDDIQGVINLDMIAYDGDGVRDVEIHAGTRQDSQALANALAASMSQHAPSLKPHIYKEDATNLSDHGSFWAYQYPAVVAAEYLFHGDINPYYHSVKCCDTVDHLNPDMAADMMRSVLATFATLGGVRAGAGAALTPTVAQPAPTAPPLGTLPGAGSRTFPETSKTVSGIFLDYWQTNGGIAQQGYPISSLMSEVSDLNGKAYTVQYFERAVFEYHPENQPPYTVLLSLLGSSAFKAKYPAGRASGLVSPPPATPKKTQCTPTHDDSDSGQGAGFVPEAPVRSVVGKGHVLTGAVFSSLDCSPIAGVKLEMRPEMGNSHPEEQRATLYTDAQGRYRFESAFPEHIHVRVSAHGYKGIIVNTYHTTPGQQAGTLDLILAPDPRCQQFSATGQSLCGAFLKYWQEHGGLAQQGYPISDEFTETSALNGKPYTVQYFERAQFEAHPENAPPFDVLLSQLGTFKYRAKYGGK